jgi:hypothetical protein
VYSFRIRFRLGDTVRIESTATDVSAFLLAPAELLLLLHALRRSVAPTMRAQAKTTRRVGRERLIMVNPQFGRRSANGAGDSKPQGANG